LSVAGHAVVLALLILFFAETRPSPKPAVPGGIQVVFSQSLQQARAVPAPEAATQPAPPSAAAPPQDALEPPLPAPEVERVVEATEPPPAPPETVETVAPLLPPRKPVARQPKPIVHRPQTQRAPAFAMIPAPAEPVARPSAATGTAQYPAVAAAPEAAVAAVPAPVPGPDVNASYQAMISAWLEGHKRYPESARERGEEGSAALRFRIDRSGRVLDYSYRSTGYADLDGGLDEMMRGAQLPPFPPGMMASRIEVSVTMQFNLTR
jgi:periplasmic protein TonB